MTASFNVKETFLVIEYKLTAFHFSYDKEMFSNE